MRNQFLIILTAFVSTITFADDADDAGAKLHEYFDAFNDRSIDFIVSDVYSTPVHMGGGDSHSLMADPDGAVAALHSLYEQLDSQGWTESRISDLQICMASDTLALVDTRYSRLKQNGEPIPPAIRTTLYVLQKLDGDWRIVSFYGHDSDKRPRCSS